MINASRRATVEEEKLEVESRVRPLKEFFPETKTRRLQPISRFGRQSKTPVQAPCVGCNCRGNTNQVPPGQQEQLQQQLRKKFGQLPTQAVDQTAREVEQGQVDGIIMNAPFEIKSKKRYAGKNAE